MTDDNTTYKENVLRELTPYFTHDLRVFFKIKRVDQTTGKHIFYKGIILDLSKSMKTLVLDDDVEGETPFLLEDILIDTIAPAKEREVKE